MKKPTEITIGNKKITTYYTPLGRVKRRDVSTINKEPSLTQAQFAEECDINNIMATYVKTGQITHLSRSQGIYQEMAEFPPDFATAMEIVSQSKQAFADLPSDVRSRFKHDPQNLIEFLKNPDNRDEAEKLGLINKAQLQNNDLNDKNKQQPKTESTKSPASPSET